MRGIHAGDGRWRKAEAACAERPFPIAADAFAEPFFSVHRIARLPDLARPQARAHVTGGGRAGSRRGIRTRRRLQAVMDASERMGPGAPRRGHA